MIDAGFCVIVTKNGGERLDFATVAQKTTISLKTLVFFLVLGFSRSGGVPPLGAQGGRRPRHLGGRAQRQVKALPLGAQRGRADPGTPERCKNGLAARAGRTRACALELCAPPHVKTARALGGVPIYIYIYI